MPTGYTAILQDKQDISFADFAKRCARAFGACIMQRDDPFDAPMLLDEQPSDYHINKLEDAESELAACRERTDSDWERLRFSELERLESESRESAKKHQAIEASYRRMLALVRDWQPPTKDHEELKKFMIQQITDSIKFDCGSTYYQEAFEALAKTTVQEFASQSKEKAMKDVVYHRKSLAEERKRVDDRNEWKRQLLASL